MGVKRLTDDERLKRVNERSRWYRFRKCNGPNGTEHRQSLYEKQKKWRQDNAEWCRFKSTLVHHGLTLDQYHAKLESQDFGCAICGSDNQLVVDHHHESGKRRGLLCWSCNTGLGMFREQLALLYMAEQYMVKWL